MNKTFVVFLIFPLFTLGQQLEKISNYNKVYFDIIEEMQERDLKRGVTMIDSLEKIATKEKDGILKYLANDLRSMALGKQSDYKKSELLLSQNKDFLETLPSSYKKTQDIAEILSISVNTVETHRKNLMRKIGTKNVVGLVKYAIQQGLI